MTIAQVAELPHDQKILRRLYNLVGNQLGRWDTARVTFKAAFQAYIDSIAAGQSERESWIIARQNMRQAGIHISSEIEELLPASARKLPALIEQQVDFVWPDEISEFNSPSTAIVPMWRLRRSNQHGRISGYFSTLIKAGQALRKQILEAMSEALPSPGENDPATQDCAEIAADELASQPSNPSPTAANSRQQANSTPIASARKKKTTDEVVTHLKAMQSDNDNRQPVGVSASQVAGDLGCSKHTVLKAFRSIGWKVNGLKPKADRSRTERRRTLGGDSLFGVASPRPTVEPSDITEEQAKEAIRKLHLKETDRDAILQQLVAGEITPRGALNVAETVSVRAR